MIRKILFLALYTISFALYAQNSELFWDQRIDSLKNLYENALSKSAKVDFNYSQDSCFVKIIVRMLNTKNSYQKKWDMLSEFLICLQSPDNKFRIITWRFPIAGVPNVFSYRGVIQFKNNNIIPLFDGYAFSQDRTQCGNYNSTDNWFGAVYYHILQIDKKENVYTLLGLRQDNVFNDQKVVDVLRINDNHVSFGGTFQMEGIDTLIYGNNFSRFVINYKKGITTALRYEKDINRLTFDHLVSIQTDNANSETQSYNKRINNIFIPNGHYLGLKYVGNGTWFFTGDVISLLKTEK